MDIGQSLPFYIIFCGFFPSHPYPNLPLTFPCVLEEAYSLSNKAALSERRVTVGADIDTGSFYFHMWSCCHSWFLKVSYIAASHFARSHSFRVTIPLDRGLRLLLKECSLTCHVFSLQFWEMVLGKLFTGKRYAFVFILLRKKYIERFTL